VLLSFPTNRHFQKARDFAEVQIAGMLSFKFQTSDKEYTEKG